MTDAHTGEKLPGVTVVVTSATLQFIGTAITDQNGRYQVTDVEPSTYKVTFYYADLWVEASAVVTSGSETIVNGQIDMTKAGGETVHVQGHAPTIVPLSVGHG